MMTPSASGSWRMQMHAQLATTQDIAIEAARMGDPGRLAIVADRQTAGRGSRGRGWSAPVGNLHLSAMLRPLGEQVDPGHWAMLAGIALHDALAPYASGLMLKWPNDLLLDGAKLGGVLIDCATTGNGLLDWIVIGMGANLAVAPCIEDRRTSCLPAPPPLARDVAFAVLDHLDRWRDVDLRTAWLARAHPVGTDINVVTPSGRVNGRFAGLTKSGALLLEGCSDSYDCADIFLVRAIDAAAQIECPAEDDFALCFSS